MTPSDLADHWPRDSIGCVEVQVSTGEVSPHHPNIPACMRMPGQCALYTHPMPSFPLTTRIAAPGCGVSSAYMRSNMIVGVAWTPRTFCGIYCPRLTEPVVFSGRRCMLSPSATEPFPTLTVRDRKSSTPQHTVGLGRTAEAYWETCQSSGSARRSTMLPLVCRPPLPLVAFGLPGTCVYATSWSVFSDVRANVV